MEQFFFTFCTQVFCTLLLLGCLLPCDGLDNCSNLFLSSQTFYYSSFDTTSCQLWSYSICRNDRSNHLAVRQVNKQWWQVQGTKISNKFLQLHIHLCDNGRESMNLILGIGITSTVVVVVSPFCSDGDNDVSFSVRVDIRPQDSSTLIFSNATVQLQWVEEYYEFKLPMTATWGDGFTWGGQSYRNVATAFYNIYICALFVLS